MTYTKSFHNLGKDDANIAGGKGASLGEMTNAKIPVPPGFVVLADSFEKFIKLTKIDVKIDAIIKKVNHKKIESVERASKQIQELILNADTPKEISKEITSEFKKLKTKYVAIRSSATSEDSADAAWAGQLDSFLNTTENSILENVKKCWASLFTPRAIFYRFEKGLQKTKISVAVVVQKMVASEVSGIAFSVHPVTEDYNQLIIEAGLGLGEAIVSGQITPDSYVVSKFPQKIVDKNINTQERGLYRHQSNSGNEWKNIPAKVGEKQCLSDKQILEVANLIIKIENHYGFPCDIEWAYEKGKFYIVQSRPITTLLKKVESENKINTDASVVLEKVFSREKTLMYMMMWDVSERLGYNKFLGYDLASSLFIYEPKTNKTSVWYDPNEAEIITRVIKEKIKQDNQTIKKVVQCLDDNWQKIFPYLSKNKKITTDQQFKSYYQGITAWWSAMNTVYPLINIPNLSPKSGKIFLKYRQFSEKYTGQMDELILEYCENNLPKKYHNLIQYLLIDEFLTLRNDKLSKADLSRVLARQKGYLIYQQQVIENYNLDTFLTKSCLSLKREETLLATSIKGVSAYQGKVIGKVRKIITKKDISKLLSGEVLVAETTYPDHVPIMKLACAFVTDEGGITCHAAIVARELKKPCIVGTKIATQVLKDGDMVEVDADNGVVKIIKN